MPRCLYLIIFFVLANIDISQGEKIVKIPQHPLIVKNDSATINLRTFNKTALNAYRKQPEFSYDDSAGSPSLWTRFWRWFWHLFSWPKGLRSPSSAFLSMLFLFLGYLVIGGGVAALVFLILKIAGIDMANIFRQKSAPAGQDYSESLENIHDINFDTGIEEALNNHNYRLAVRLLYLKCLKQLNDASLIKWQPEKTNSNYVNELTDAGQKVFFKSLTRQFEYVWYGEFPIDGATFNKVNRLFGEFKSKIG